MGNMRFFGKYEVTPGELSPLRKILRYVKRVFPIVWLLQLTSSLARKFSSGVHHIQYLFEWGVDNPEYFDHFIDQHYAWKKTRNSLMWERGVFSNLAIQAMTKEEGKLPSVLELCCGDGFMAYHFYSLLSEKVVAVDFDSYAIKRAKSNCGAKNIHFLVGDIRHDIPNGQFENVIWDAAIEHFTESEIVDLMATIKSRLVPEGILSGYTIKEDHEGQMHLHQHEYEFHNKQDLARFLEPHFRNVQVIETVFPSRTNLYFYASDGELPFESHVSLVRKIEH